VTTPLCRFPTFHFEVPFGPMADRKIAMRVGDRIGRLVAISADIVENCSVSGLRKVDGPVNFVEDAPWTKQDEPKDS
jgi:hypothetical protein